MSDPYAAQPSAAGPAAASAAPSPGRRTSLIVTLAAVGAAVLALVIAAVVGIVIGIASHAPGRQVDAYLSALQAGHASQALRLDGTRVAEGDVLLSDEAYRRATDRVDRFHVGKAVVRADEAVVTARIRQAGATYSQTFTLHKTGKDWLLFDHWRLQPVTLATLQVTVAAPDDAVVSIAGTSVLPQNGTIALRALPGSYPVRLADSSTWYTADAATATAVGFGANAGRPARLETRLSGAGEDAANEAVAAYVDGCAASTDLRPAGCSFGVDSGDDGYSYTNLKWTIDPRPTWQLGAWTGAGWSVTTTAPGAANLSADVAGNGTTGSAAAGPIRVEVEGIVGFDDSGATFTSVQYR